MPRHARGQIRNRGAGIWQVSAPRAKGATTRRYVTVRGTKAQAYEELDRLFRRAGKRAYRDSDATLADLIREWLAVAELEDTTRGDYERVIRVHLPHKLARTKVTRIEPFDLDSLYRSLRDDGVGEHRIRRLHTVLRRAYAQAVRWRWVDHNPVIDATPPRAPKPEIRPPAAAGVKAAVAGALREDLAVWIRVAASTGARRGELAGLRWEDVDGPHLWFRRSVAYTPKTGVYVKDTKTHQVRRVLLDGATLGALERYRDGLMPERTKPDCYVFSHAINGLAPWRPDYVNRPLAKLGVGLHPHALRHFVATQLTAAGVDPRTISERLGHERTSTTMDMYSHWTDGTGQAAADHMGRILG